MKTVEFNKITGVVKSYIAELREMYTACNNNGIITVELTRKGVGCYGFD